MWTVLGGPGESPRFLTASGTVPAGPSSTLVAAVGSYYTASSVAPGAGGFMRIRICECLVFL
ncbi:MAG: hypothetical protein ACREBU_22895, partial [Nitrososphaera sp.]